MLLYNCYLVYGLVMCVVCVCEYEHGVDKVGYYMPSSLTLHPFCLSCWTRSLPAGLVGCQAALRPACFCYLMLRPCLAIELRSSRSQGKREHPLISLSPLIIIFFILFTFILFSNGYYNTILQAFYTQLKHYSVVRFCPHFHELYTAS